MCVCVCCSLSLLAYLFVGDGGWIVSSLLFFSKPVQCGAPGPTSDYPAFRGSQRLGALFPGSVEIPVVLLVSLWCVCVRARARRGVVTPVHCGAPGTTRDYSALFTGM